MAEILRLADHTDSQFYKRLQACAGQKRKFNHAQVTHLMASVDYVVEQSTEIAMLTVHDLPQYTLHGEMHMLNVLSIMDALVPQGTMDQLSPLECALCIMATYTQGLGMAQSAEERRLIREPGTDEYAAFQGFRATYVSLVQRVRHLEETAKAARDTGHKTAIQDEIGAIESHILSESIRRTHPSLYKRMSDWQERIEKTMAGAYVCPIYGNFRDRLSLIAASCDRDVKWLREGLTGPGSRLDDFVQMVDNHGVNWTFPGLLLRLANLLDLDWTRTPKLLFDNLGFDEWLKTPDSLQAPGETTWQEWSKHVLTIGWNFFSDGDRPTLRLEARCWTPVIHKALLDFGKNIDAEFASTQRELECQRALIAPGLWHYDLPLPTAVDLRVTAKCLGGRPAYRYRDIQFSLSPPEILQLLMGTSLYGDPTLCIRELLQNALDATLMRDLRLGIDARNRLVPTDPLDGGRELAVMLTWGLDENCGQSFVQVTDHGIGMTPQDLEEYFTQVGKSYYRSHDYERERQVFENAGHYCSPISIFGIGIVSCFMVADRIEVRTRPGGWHEAASHDRCRPTDLTISGPGSLFWLRDGTLDHQGTEVRIYLKPEFALCHDPKTMWEELNEGLDPRHSRENTSHRPAYPGAGKIDPALVATSHCIWPSYRVRIEPPGGTEIVIDDQLHVHALGSIDNGDVREKVQEWDLPVGSCLGTNVHWAWWDWVDEGHTGSRVRLWYPAHDGRKSPAFPMDSNDGGLMRLDTLAALVELQLRADADARSRWLVKGMAVSDVGTLKEETRLIPHVGGLLWVDLRGEAAPNLTVDRSAVIAGPPREHGGPITSMFERLARALADTAGHSTGPDRNLRAIWRLYTELPCAVPDDISPVGSLNGMLIKLGSAAPWVVARLEQDLSRALDSVPFLARDLPLVRVLNRDPPSQRRAHVLDCHLENACRPELGPSSDLDSVLARALDGVVARTHARTRAYGLVRDLVYSFALERQCVLGVERPHGFVPDRRFVLDSDLDDVLDLRGLKTDIHGYPNHVAGPWGDALLSHLLSEALQPSLEHSLPMLECFWLKGKPEDLHLMGPAVLSCKLESNGRTVIPNMATPWLDERLCALGYDLVFPITAIPLGALRAKAWQEFKEQRLLRAFVTFPFLVPEVAGRIGENLRVVQPLLELLPLKRVHVLMPRMELWDTEFRNWDDDDWQTCGISGLWDIKGGWVKWLPGPAVADEIAKNGIPLDEVGAPSA